jgi:hypothetical protein
MNIGKGPDILRNQHSIHKQLMWLQPYDCQALTQNYLLEMQKLLWGETQLHRETHNTSEDYLQMIIKLGTVKAYSFL